MTSFFLRGKGLDRSERETHTQRKRDAHTEKERKEGRAYRRTYRERETHLQRKRDAHKKTERRTYRRTYREREDIDRKMDRLTERQKNPSVRGERASKDDKKRRIR